jgi:hypothetical protein
MTDLKLGPLPKNETVRLSITVTKPLKDALDLYAQEYSKAYEPTDTATLIPHMLEAFLRSDKAFMKRHADSIRARAAQAPSPLPAASSAANGGHGGSL